MKQLLKKTMIAASCASFLFLSACNDDDKDLVITPPATQHYVGEKPYTLAQMEGAASVSIMTYRMDNVQNKKADATALVFFPKSAQPKDGWRVVVWEHGTVGSGDSCAPSNNAFNANFKNMAVSLLAAGYVIVAPDYEGLGTPGIHPYLNLGSAAKSAQYAIKATKEKYADRINGAWMSVGQSQGGHASLATAEYANGDASYKGGVAGAPASSLGVIISEIAPVAIKQLWDNDQKEMAIGVYSELLSYAAYTTLGMKAIDPKYNYQGLFETRSALVAEYAEGSTGENGECLVPLRDRFAKDIMAFLTANPDKTVMDYPALKAGFQDDPVVKKFLAENQPGTKKINAPVMIIQGKLDEAVPFIVTDKMQEAMKKMGTDVTFVPVEGATHTQAIVQKNDTLVKFIQEKMPAK